MSQLHKVMPLKEDLWLSGRTHARHAEDSELNSLYVGERKNSHLKIPVGSLPLSARARKTKDQNLMVSYVHYVVRESVKSNVRMELYIS